MSIPDLDLTVRLVGLPLPDLWGRYLALGGSLTLQELARRISGGASWPREQELFLAVALSDALIEASLDSLDPLRGFVDEAPPGAASTAADPPPGGPRAEPLPFAGGCLVDLDQLVLRARAARVAARRIRLAAAAARGRAAASTRALERGVGR